MDCNAYCTYGLFLQLLPILVLVVVVIFAKPFYRVVSAHSSFLFTIDWNRYSQWTSQSRTSSSIFSSHHESNLCLLESLIVNQSPDYSKIHIRILPPDWSTILDRSDPLMWQRLMSLLTLLKMSVRISWLVEFFNGLQPSKNTWGPTFSPSFLPFSFLLPPSSSFHCQKVLGSSWPHLRVAWGFFDPFKMA